MNIRFNKKRGFSLLELMVFFLFLSIILAASTPLITKKFRNIPPRLTHGKYICYNDGGTQKEASYNTFRKVSDGPAIDGQCKFDPPDSASLFKIEIIGGGAGGYIYHDWHEEEKNVTGNNRPKYTLAGGYSGGEALSFARPAGNVLYEAFNNEVVTRTLSSGRGGGTSRFEFYAYPLPINDNLYCQVNTKTYYDGDVWVGSPWNRNFSGAGDCHGYKVAQLRKTVYGKEPFKTAVTNTLARYNNVLTLDGFPDDSQLNRMYGTPGDEDFIAYSIGCGDLFSLSEYTKDTLMPNANNYINQYKNNPNTTNQYLIITSDKSIKEREVALKDELDTDEYFMGERQGGYPYRSPEHSGKVKQYMPEIQHALAAKCESPGIGLLATPYSNTGGDTEGLITPTVRDNHTFYTNSRSGGPTRYLVLRNPIILPQDDDASAVKDEYYNKIAALLKRYVSSDYVKKVSCDSIQCRGTDELRHGYTDYVSGLDGAGLSDITQRENNNPLLTAGKLMPNWEYYNTDNKEKLTEETKLTADSPDPYNGKEFPYFNGFALKDPTIAAANQSWTYVTFDKKPTGAIASKVFLYTENGNDEEDLATVMAENEAYADKSAHYNHGRIFYTQGKNGKPPTAKSCVNNSNSECQKVTFSDSSVNEDEPTLWIDMITQVRWLHVGNGGAAGKKTEFTLASMPDNCKIYAGAGGQAIDVTATATPNESDIMKSYISCGDNNEYYYEALGGDTYIPGVEYTDDNSESQISSEKHDIFNLQRSGTPSITTTGKAGGPSPYKEKEGQSVFLKYGFVGGNYGQGGSPSSLKDECIESNTTYSWNVEYEYKDEVRNVGSGSHTRQCDITASQTPTKAGAGTGGAVIISW